MYKSRKSTTSLAMINLYAATLVTSIKISKSLAPTCRPFSPAGSRRTCFCGFPPHASKSTHTAYGLCFGRYFGRRKDTTQSTSTELHILFGVVLSCFEAMGRSLGRFP
ncbi:hypothetical protein EV126DRAFT_173716 [Verticillium dahliae]|nr:hypothetical protein EV126DRAFT_173716 [Verticillium dahliae]